MLTVCLPHFTFRDGAAFADVHLCECNSRHPRCALVSVQTCAELLYHTVSERMEGITVPVLEIRNIASQRTTRTAERLTIELAYKDPFS